MEMTDAVGISIFQRNQN